MDFVICCFMVWIGFSVVCGFWNMMLMLLLWSWVSL